MDVTTALLDLGAIVRAREDGASYAELTARFGCCPGQLKTILRKHGLHGSPSMRRRIPPETKARMCELADAGMSRRRIAKATGWSLGAVGRVLRRREA